jgi:hypothetical protein
MFVLLKSRRERGLLAPMTFSLIGATAAFVPWLVPTLARRAEIVAVHTIVSHSSALRYSAKVARTLFALLVRSLSELFPYSETWKTSAKYQAQSAIWLGLAVLVIAMITLSLLARRDSARRAILLLPALSMIGGLFLIDLVTGTDRSQCHRYYLPCVTCLLVLIGIVMVEPAEDPIAPTRAARAAEVLQQVLRRAQFPTIVIMVGLGSSLVQVWSPINWLNGEASYPRPIVENLQHLSATGHLPTIGACQSNTVEILIIAHQVDPRAKWELSREPCQLFAGPSTATHILTTSGFSEYGEQTRARLRRYVVATSFDENVQLARIDGQG